MRGNHRGICSPLLGIYRKINHLTGEFHVKLHVVFQVKFNVEFTSQVINFSCIAQVNKMPKKKKRIPFSPQAACENHFNSTVQN